MNRLSLRILSFILLVMVFVSASMVGVLADSFVVAGEQFSYRLNNEGTYTITGYDGDEEIVTVPAYIDGIAVTELAGYSLYNSMDRTVEVVIPETISKICPNALTCNGSVERFSVDDDNPYYCDIDGVIYTKDVTCLVQYPEGKSGVSYQIVDGVRELGPYSFHYAFDLETISFPEGLKKICERAFYSCNGLKAIQLPEGLETIGSDAFYGCESLTDVVIPDSVTTMESRVFDSCRSLRSVHIGQSVQSVGQTLFSGTYSLETITVSSDNQYFCADKGVLFDKNKTILYKYPSQKADLTYTVPSTVKAIKSDSFSAVEYTENIFLSEGLQTIEDEAFKNCKALRSFEIPSSVTYMGYILMDCDSLERVYIGKNVSNIEENSNFFNCDVLTSIEVDSENQWYSSVDGVLYDKDITRLITFPGGLSMSDYNIPSTVREITYNTFNDQDNYWDDLSEDGFVYVDDCLLEYSDGYGDHYGNVNVPVSTRIIGGYAFWASDIWGVSLPDETRIISSYAFASCSNLQSVYIPEGIRYMGDNCFIHCSSLYDIYYGGTEEQWNSIDNIQEIGISEYTVIHFGSEGNEYVNPVIPEDMYQHTYTDEEWGISVSTDTVADLNATNITGEEIVASVDELLPKAKVEAVYEINLSAEGEEVQPVDMVMVKIPTNNRFARVYRMEEDGTLTDMNAEYIGGYLVFYTDHFSLYALGLRQASAYNTGDVDMDERLSVKDATAIQKSVAQVEEYQQDVVELLMDYDGDGAVSVRDATAIQKTLVGLDY